MKLLAIDTTSECGSIALVEDDRVVEEVSLRCPEGFGHILFGEIEKLLRRQGISVTDLDGFAAAAGPGSFTGVRIGLTAVKGLAEATGRKVVPVSNLEALAYFGTQPLRAPVLDGRRGDVFGAVYTADLLPVREEMVMPLAEWLSTLPDGDVELITSNALLDLRAAPFPVRMAPASLAGAIGRIASARFGAGLAQDPAEIDANYVRRSDAELAWRDVRDSTGRSSTQQSNKS